MADVALSTLDAADKTRAVIRSRQVLHVARTALAVEQFRIERGHWPEKLAELVPDYLEAVPQDWFAPKGTMIAYTRTATGVRLWSRCGSEWGVPGLTGDEELGYTKLVRDIAAFKKYAGRLPTDLGELDADEYGPFPMNPRTGKPYSYVTNPANPELFILGGFTKGMSEEEFWKQTLTTEDWVWEARRMCRGVVFCLLNPELRGAKQARFADEVFLTNCTKGIRDLGYTRERLKELGFTDDDVDSYESELSYIEEDEAEERKRKGLPATPEVVPDTEVSPAP